MVNLASAYTDPGRFADDLRILFREGPTLIGLSSEMAKAGSNLSTELDGIPVAATPTGRLVAGDGERLPPPACAARLERCGNVGQSLVCSYRGWTYDTDGRLLARPLFAGALDDVPDLQSAPGGGRQEIWADLPPRGGSADPIDVDDILAGARTIRGRSASRATHIGNSH